MKDTGRTGRKGENSLIFKSHCITPMDSKILLRAYLLYVETLTIQVHSIFLALIAPSRNSSSIRRIYLTLISQLFNSQTKELRKFLLITALSLKIFQRLKYW